jgi:hypothetical protein
LSDRVVRCSSSAPTWASRKAIARLTAEAPARAGEAALVDGRHEDFHGVDAIHAYFRFDQHSLAGGLDIHSTSAN